jgi:hypothetical protein
MRRNVRRVMMSGTMVALVAILLMSTGALAKGPDGATQARAGEAGKALQTRTQSQERAQVRVTASVCSTCSGAGSQARNGAQVQIGDGYGLGDGTGPVPGGSFGPGPKGKCLDLDKDGICDCRE